MRFINKGLQCIIPTCNRDAFCREYCHAHYSRWWKHGRVRADVPIKKLEYHNGYGTAEYQSWQLIKRRCYYEAEPAYKHYGGNGVIVCSKWRKSFSAFLLDMGEKPLPKDQYCIHRLNSKKNYQPNNTVWILKSGHAKLHGKLNSKRAKRRKKLLEASK